MAALTNISQLGNVLNTYKMFRILRLVRAVTGLLLILPNFL